MSLSYSLNRSSISGRLLFKKAHREPLSSESRLTSSPSLKQNAIQVTVFFIAYYIAGVLGQATTNIRSSNIGPVWPAYGVALAAFLVCGYRVWPAIALGAFVVALSSPVTPLAALGQAVGATLAAFSGAYLLYHILEFDCSLSRLRDALALVLLGALGSSLVSATIGVSVLYGTHVHAYSGPGSAWLIYWLGDTTGVLLVTPLVLTFPTLFRIRDGHRLREFAALLLLLTATSFAAFGLLPLIPGRVHHMAFAVLPFVMWAAIRFGTSVTALSIFLLTTIATVETALGSGPFTTNTPLMNAVLLDIFFGVVSVTGLSLAATVAEREHAERERERLVRERAEAEARLRFAGIVESSEDAIISKNLDAVIVSWNAGAQRTFGYSEQEAVGRPITILIPSELREEENKILERLRAGEHIDHYETIRVTKAGNKINVSLSISPIKNSTGRIVGFCKIARDITERKLAEEALRNSEERLRLAQWAAHIGTFDLNIRTGVDIWQPETEALYGLPPGGFGGTLTAFEELIHPHDRERIIELTREMMKTGQPAEAEWRVVWPDGSVHWIAGRGLVLMDELGNPSRMLGVNMDITERKLAEEARFRHAAIVESSEDAIASGTPDGIIVSWNAGAQRMYGYTEAEAVGKRISILVPPELPDEETKILETLKMGGRIEQFETVRVTKTGKRINVSLSISPIKDSSGAVVGVAGIARDITDRKRAEEARADMSRKLIAAQEQERARIGRELHDDINQRLAMLALELEQLRGNSPDASTRLQELRKQTTELSNDVQALSHELHSSKLEYLGVVSGIKSWCKEFGELQKMEIDFKGDVSSVLPFDVGIGLFRVLQESLHNAVKHSGVKRIEVQLREASDEIHLIVNDLGRGFDVETAFQGRGLGLTSMQERVRLLNGSIEIQSKPMGGTTIHVRVPLESKQASQREAV